MGIPNYSCGKTTVTCGTDNYDLTFAQYSVTDKSMQLQIVVHKNGEIVLNHVPTVTPSGIPINMSTTEVSLIGNIAVSNHVALNIYEFNGTLSVEQAQLTSFDRKIVVITQPSFE